MLEIEQTWSTGGEEDKTESALTLLDEQLDRYEKTLVVAEGRLTMVLSRYDEEAKMASSPRPEPASLIRSKAERLRDLNAAFDRLLGRLDI